MAAITFDKVSKTYADGTTAVRDLDLAIEDGEFMILVGPSGCGKSTALRMLAGLEEITGGEVRIGDRVVNQLAPRDRNIAMVFQNYALYPHMSVRDNLGFALKVAKTPKEEINRRVNEAAKMLGLTEYLDRKPKALSGGQRQRVAMGRAIVREPAAFLMDEPLSNLDAKLRVQMRGDIRQLQSRLGTTTVYVTHDQVEAMTMGDRVAVIRKGILQQAAPPQELYERPDNLFVAGFIGSPAMNLISATVVQADGGLAVDVGPDRFALAPGALAAYPQVASKVGEHVVMGIRPEDFEDAAASDLPASQRLTVTTTLVEAMGSEIFLHFELPVPPPETEDTRELREDVDEASVEALAEEGTTPITARLEPTTRAQLGQPIELAVDTAKAHFFEPASGSALR